MKKIFRNSFVVFSLIFLFKEFGKAQVDTVNAIANISPMTYISASDVNVPVAVSGSFGNVAQIQLTPGDWEVTGIVSLNMNGATLTSTTAAISVNSGNITSDHVVGDNQIDGFLATALFSGNIVIPMYRVQVVSSQTVYLKVKSTYAIATPTVNCRLSARRFGS